MSMDSSKTPENGHPSTERVVKEGDLVLVPGQLMHTIKAINVENPYQALQELLSSTEYRKNPMYNFDYTFNFHVTGTDRMPAGLTSRTHYSVDNPERPIGVVMKPQLSDTTASLLNTGFLSALIKGAQAEDGRFSLATFNNENALRELGDLQIQLAHLGPGESRDIANLFLYSVFVAKFYQKYRQTGIKDYMGVTPYPYSIDGVVAPGFGVSGFQREGKFVQSYIFKPEDVAALVVREEVAEQVKASLPDTFQRPVYTFPTLALLR